MTIPNQCHKQVLIALRAEPKPVTPTDLQQKVIGASSEDSVRNALRSLLANGLVDVHSGDIWSINDAGIEALSEEIINQANAEPYPVPTLEPTHGTVRQQASAMVCINEEELDFWWHGLSVESKADAFVGLSIRAQGQDESFVYTEPYASVRAPLAQMVR